MPELAPLPDMRVVPIGPSVPAVSWEEADAHLRLDGDAEQRVYVEALIAAATDHISGPPGWLGRSVGIQELEVRFSLVAVGASIDLPYPPAIALTNVRYLDVAGIERMADLADFDLSGDRIFPKGASWPWEGGSLKTEAGRIRYRAGYEIVPAPIKAAILLMVGDLYRFRTTASDMGITPTAIPMSVTVNGLLQPYRVYR